MSQHYKQVLKFGRKFKSLSPIERHEVRIALKKLRYAAEFFDAQFPASRARAYLTAMKRLQNALGAANDVAVAEDLTQGLVKTVRHGSKEAAALQQAAGKVLGWHSRAAADAEADILSLWTTFAKGQPFWLAS